MTLVNELLESASQLGLTQAQVAELIGVGRQQLHYYKSGRNEPRPARVIRMRRLMGYFNDIAQYEPCKVMLLNESPTLERITRLARIARARAVPA